MGKGKEEENAPCFQVLMPFSAASLSIASASTSAGSERNQHRSKGRHERERRTVADVVDSDGSTVGSNVLGLERGKLVVGHSDDVEATVDVEHRGEVGEGDGLRVIDGGKDEVCEEKKVSGSSMDGGAENGAAKQ
jgi:hypothetical protein